MLSKFWTETAEKTSSSFFFKTEVNCKEHPNFVGNWNYSHQPKWDLNGLDCGTFCLFLSILCAYWNLFLFGSNFDDTIRDKQTLSSFF